LATLIGVIGFLLSCAGMDLLWQSREDLLYWLSSYLKIFRSTLKTPQVSPREVWIARKNFPPLPKTQSHRTLAMVLGVGLAFVGPLLIIVSLVISLYPKM
jgi:hypothetical protein